MQRQWIVRGVTAIIVGGIATLTACGGGGSASSGDSTMLTVAELVARDANGVAVHLGEQVTTEGVVTVSAGVYSNNKLKVFIQDGVDGLMAYHQNAGDVDAFQPGDALQVTGVVRQEDPTADNNPAKGTVLVDLTDGAWTLLSHGNALPAARSIAMRDINDSDVGIIVRIPNAQKVAGNWPVLGSKSTEVTVSDDGGTTNLVLRFQRNTITPAMVDKLAAIGDDPFTLLGILVQDDVSDDGQLLDGFEIWLRGSEDVEPAA